MLESGRHVVCEKPLAINSAQTRALRDLAAARARPGRGGELQRPLLPALPRDARPRGRAGDLGRVLSVTGSYTQDWLLSPDDYNWRVEPDGGTNLRAVADIGTHWMDLAQFVVGRPIRSLIADLATFHPIRHRPVGPSETFSGPGGARRRRSRSRHDRGPRRRPLPDGRRDPGRVPRLAGHGGPQEPARPGSGRHARLDGLGQRGPRAPLGRPPRRAERTDHPRPRPALRPGEPP